jgi:hypothetical protein
VSGELSEQAAKALRDLAKRLTEGDDQEEISDELQYWADRLRNG